ncbi:hypothetical protein KNU84_gp025 [Bacteriophage DSS3_VP1]|uniref:Uncharacterized protein n=1 Tax=Bacteriophage DSS3_VP1 TaxID=2664196 RepID=A0A7S5FQA0_9CAUD|nr:hypothetical protein KNU84_gp025 [Bacteriophage DSS3_VP1]QGH74594.1 hypothetical protein DSS3VP1_00025 [Bacteriophage DSS3_VP1]
MKNIIFLVLVGTILVGCSGMDIAKFALGGGADIIPDVAQVGKTNTQTLGTNEITEVVIKDVTGGQIRPVVRPEGITTTAPVENVTQTNYNVPPIWIIALVVWSIFLWQLPSPSELSRKFWSFFGKRK